MHVHCGSILVNIVNVFKICPINQPLNAPLESDRYENICELLDQKIGVRRAFTASLHSLRKQ